MTGYQMVKTLFYDWFRQLDTISACEKQTSRHLTIAKRAITQRRAGEKTDCVEINSKTKKSRIHRLRLRCGNRELCSDIVTEESGQTSRFALVPFRGLF